MNITYATTNKYKLAGANQALLGAGLTLTASDSELPDVPEIQSDSQEEVSIDKAQKYYELLKSPLVVMDSGLFIKSLKGFPGVYTKYALDTIGIENIVKLLKDDRGAYTQRTVTYLDGLEIKTFTYKVHGELLSEPRGENGRDYDKYFKVDGANKTIAEMSDDEKTDMIAVVWKELAQWLQQK